MVQSIFSSSKQQHADNAPEHTSFSDQHAHERTNRRKMHLLFKQRSTGLENYNCIGLKLAKTLAPGV